MSEEEDYMSNKFLQESATTPSISLTYAERRKQKQRQQEQNRYIKPRALREREVREEGMRKEIEEDNEGMKMLMKMGYSKGMGLGKHGEGIKAPISVEIKEGRKGIGLETANKRTIEDQLEADRTKRQKMDQEYREQLVSNFNEERDRRRLKAAVNICEELDAKKDIESNPLWSLVDETKEVKNFATTLEQLVEEDENDKNDTSQLQELKSAKTHVKLEQIIEYLRLEHFYCFWCATKYVDVSDISENCPGITEADHD